MTFADDAKSAARGRWPDILANVGGFNPESLTGDHGPCPMCKQGKDCFRAFDDVAETGGVYCNKCHSSDNGDGFSALQKMLGKSFAEVLQLVADYLGVQKQTNGHGTNGELRKQFVTWCPTTSEQQQGIDDLIEQFAASKPPITAESVKAAGGIVATWPISNAHGQTVIAIPATLRDGDDPSAWVLRRVDGKEFPGVGNLGARKTHTLRGSTKAWIVPGGFERLRQAKNVLRVEGEADALAVFPLLPDDWAVVTNTCGAKSVPENIGIFAGKTVYSLGDADEPGQIGAAKLADKIQGVADLVKVPELPYEVEPDHGKDLRDWLNEGHTFADLQALCEAAPKHEKQKRGKNRASRVSLSNDSGSDPWTDIGRDQGRTEVANSRRFNARHADRVGYVNAWQKPLIWTGKQNQIDDSGAVLRLGKEVADSLWAEVVTNPSDDAVRFAVESSKASKIAAATRLAMAEVPIDVADLDANPWLLNCDNGTIDLRTGKLRPHRREDWITKICPTRFNPDAPSYHFDRFLESTLESALVIDFLRRLAGYCLTGLVSEQILPVFWGGGANGKTTLLNAWQDTLGSDYSGAAPASLLMERKQSEHPTELADLFGRRVVVASETNQGAKLAESTVKQLTGGDIISARRMREDFWTFKPTHKLLLLTNHKPQIKGTDEAIWRRIVLIPFVRKFWNPDKGETGPAELRQDKTLADRLHAEREGILAWMVRGCLEWQKDGLQIPDAVRVATAEYRSESDTVGRFIAECCITGNPDVFKVRFSDLYARLESWCNDSGDNLPSRKFTGQYLQDQRFRDRHSGARWYLGIALREIEQTEVSGTSTEAEQDSDLVSACNRF